MAESEKVSGVMALPQFLKDSWLELKKVHAPTRQETIQATIVTLIMLFFVSLFLGGVDFLLGIFMSWATS
jgi:preprotein translocase subunit SecE